MSSKTQTRTNSNSHTLDLQISDPVSMLNEIARRYESTERILMEYVDNALDDAENLYRANNQAYPYEIQIEIILDPLARAIIIRDNCRGMEQATLERIVRNVGESQKRGLTWVNGRFGFGVQAFRAAAEVIRFQTKTEAGPHLALQLARDQHRGIQGAQTHRDPFPSDTGTGTVVIINDFEEEWFEGVTVGSIREEIESHFERLLARSKLTITVQEVDGEPLRCQPFRYEEVPGKAIQHRLMLKFKGKIYPVDVYLKVADVEVPGRIVRFFARGRRINQVAEIKSFIRKSAYRTSVWGHPHLLGYIEVGEIVRPVITRDDFVRNKGRNIFYEGILSLENEVKNALDRVNEAQRDTTLNHLEDVLRQVLDNIARQDRRQLRLNLATRRNPQPASPAERPSSEAESTPPEAETPPPGTQPPLNLGPWPASPVIPAGHDPNWPASPEANPDLTLGPAYEVAEAASSQNEIHTPQNTDSPSNEPNLGGPGDEITVSYQGERPPSPRPSAQRRRSGFDIQFFDIPPDAEGQVKRSYLVGSTIYINVAHPDFQDRLVYTRQGRPRVTDRLNAYIAATVSIHYKDQFYNQYGQIPERRDLLFDEQVDFMFRLESALRDHLPALERELAQQNRSDEGEE